MLVLLSPAKRLNFKKDNDITDFTQPYFISQSIALIESLKLLSKKEVQTLLDVSDSLTELNYNRYKEFQTPFTLANAKQALFAFEGDVFQNMNRTAYSQKDLEFCQKHIRILSGLYGVLKPLDLIQPYRLEMGRKFGINGAKNLYDFWKATITEFLKNDTESEILNLASNEYSDVVSLNDLNKKFITCIFKSKKNGEYKNIGLLSKRARGMMADWIVKNNITKIKDCIDFNENGYYFSKDDSDEKTFVFLKDSV